MFVGREDELKELKERLSSDTAEAICILGRRRIGKSQLIFNSYQDFDGIVVAYECSCTSYKDNINKITNLIRKLFDNEYLRFDSLYDIIVFLQKESSKQKILFVIDEYPYMREGKGTDSEIKNAIDKFDQTTKKPPFKFIVCGSSVQVMDILDDVSMPLHGRFTSIIRLHPLDYLSSSLFYKNATLEDKVKYYVVFGGIPYFLNQIDSKRSFDENVVKLFFSMNGLLRSELENQINCEINKIEKATFILNILKDKTKSYNDISQVFKSSFREGEIDYPLNKLIKMKVVEKLFIEQDNGKKKPYYRIADRSIVFYYVFLAESFANSMLFEDKEYYQLFIKDKLLNDFVPHAFENIGMQFLSFMNKKNLLPFKLLDLCPYIINDKTSKSNYQFDVVGKTKNGLINFECKFQDKPIKNKEVYAEQRQAQLANSSFIETVFISKSKVEGCNKAYYLKDLFSL